MKARLLIVDDEREIRDLAMPGALTGDQAIRTLAALTPVILVTANLDENLARELLQAGAFDYVAKPFDLEHVRAIVETAIAFRPH
jgi:DNA-binding NtrC family response regulator